MHNIFSNRGILKWSLVAAEVALSVAAVLPKVTASIRKEQGPEVREPIPTGDFGLLLLDEQGSVIHVHRFKAGEVRWGYVNKESVQEVVRSAGASGAVMTYESSGLVVDNPSDYRDVIRGIHQALTEIDVRLLSKALLESK